MAIKKNLDFYRSLPLLESERKFFEDIDLSNTLIIGVQHLCSTTYSLIKNLFESGLNPKNLYLLGKCYSTNPKIFFQLSKEGVNVSSASLSFNSHSSYDLDFEGSCNELIEYVISTRNLNEFEKIIILDDGGHLIERVNLTMPKHLNLVGVEQTSSGYNRLRNEILFFPIVNLARSRLKLEYESPIIVRLTQRLLLEKLSKIATSSDKMLLIGYGALGQQLYQSLKNKFDVIVFDLDQKKSMIKNCEFKNRLNEFDIIIGSTGTTSLTSEHLKYLKRPVVLASISSSDREFEAVKIRKQHRPYQDCHTDITIDGISLLNSGFPITFDADFDGIDTDDFQLTRASIFASICQAFLTQSKIGGFVEMREDYQKRLLNNFNSIAPQ